MTRAARANGLKVREYSIIQCMNRLAAKFITPYAESNQALLVRKMDSAIHSTDLLSFVGTNPLNGYFSVG